VSRPSIPVSYGRGQGNLNHENNKKGKKGSQRGYGENRPYKRGSSLILLAIRKGSRTARPSERELQIWKVGKTGRASREPIAKLLKKKTRRRGGEIEEFDGIQEML